MDSPGRIELPSEFRNADIDHLVILIADMLERLMEHNDRIPLSPESLTRFHSRSPPSISVLDYLHRIVRYANVERTCLLITLHYIDQICARLTHFTLSSLTCHRFVITATVVASKALCDSFCTNAHYAKVGGLRVGELNMLEKELLSAIDWRLTTTREVLDAYYVNLVRTNSSGAYTIAAPPAPEHGTSPGASSGEADSDMDSVRSTSPVPQLISNMPTESGAGSVAGAPASHIHRTTDHDTRALAENANRSSRGRAMSTAPTAGASHVLGPSTVLRDRATLSPRISAGPTFEQNMAFAALREPGPGPGNVTVSVPTNVTVASESVRETIAPARAGSSVLPSSAPPTGVVLTGNGVTLSECDANAVRFSASRESGLSTNPTVGVEQPSPWRTLPSTVHTLEAGLMPQTEVIPGFETVLGQHRLSPILTVASPSAEASTPESVSAMPDRMSPRSGREFLNKRIVEDTLSEPENPGHRADVHYLSPRPRARPRT